MYATGIQLVPISLGRLCALVILVLLAMDRTAQVSKLLHGLHIERVYLNNNVTLVFFVLEKSFLKSRQRYISPVLFFIFP